MGFKDFLCFELWDGFAMFLLWFTDWIRIGMGIIVQVLFLGRTHLLSITDFDLLAVFMDAR
jgi:hypothetical protein